MPDRTGRRRGYGKYPYRRKGTGGHGLHGFSSDAAHDEAVIAAIPRGPERPECPYFNVPCSRGCDGECYHERRALGEGRAGQAEAG